MSYKRRTFPLSEPSHDDLTSMMAGIGMNVAANPAFNPNIEDTLYWASVDGMVNEDYRTLGVLAQWLELHLPRINADRMVRILEHDEVNPQVKAFWKAISQWHDRDRRLGRLKPMYRGRKIGLPTNGTDFLIKRHGEDERFQGTILRVPASLLRRREGDVLYPEALAKRHPAYRWRILTGPTYRADMLAELESSPNLSAYELAKRTYGSFATAHETKRDWELAKGSTIQSSEGVVIG
jgi:hypothetical protein